MKLEDLNLSENRIKCAGAIAIARAFSKFDSEQRTLKDLDLSNNMIAGDGVFAIGEQLRFNPQLVNLHLSANGSIPYNFLLDIKT